MGPLKASRPNRTAAMLIDVTIATAVLAAAAGSLAQLQRHVSDRRRVENRRLADDLAMATLAEQLRVKTPEQLRAMPSTIDNRFELEIESFRDGERAGVIARLSVPDDPPIRTVHVWVWES